MPTRQKGGSPASRSGRVTKRKFIAIRNWNVEWKRYVMAHAQKPDLVFQRNGRVHLYRRGCQFNRLLEAEVCASAVVMLDRPCSHTVHECWIPTPFASFPFTSPPVLRRVPSDSISTLIQIRTARRWTVTWSTFPRISIIQNACRFTFQHSHTNP